MTVMRSIYLQYSIIVRRDCLCTELWPCLVLLVCRGKLGKVQTEKEGGNKGKMVNQTRSRHFRMTLPLPLSRRFAVQDDEEVNQIVLEEILTCAGYVYARCASNEHENVSACITGAALEDDEPCSVQLGAVNYESKWVTKNWKILRMAGL